MSVSIVSMRVPYSHYLFHILAAIYRGKYERKGKSERNGCLKRKGKNGRNGSLQRLPEPANYKDS